jgi:hypothetical protein
MDYLKASSVNPEGKIEESQETPCSGQPVLQGIRSGYILSGNLMRHSCTFYLYES